MLQKSGLAILGTVFTILHLTAQVHITFLLDTATTNKYDSVFLAGNLNNWQPAKSNFLFNKGILRVPVQPNDIISFKLTRGSWDKVESANGGNDIPNRTYQVFSDTVIHLSAEAWKDAFEPVIKKHTASRNVSLLDTAFLIPQLSRTRAVRIYLPPDYATSNKHYPVLYMTDGQNCFDEFTGSFGEWQVDEALDRFYDSCKKSLIVIAVDHGDKHRLQEYDPYDFAQFGKGEGKLYAEFLAKSLKPFIDRNYRTLAGKNDTHLAGSSMGGVISTYTLIAYPNLFGNVGVFSPAFWTARQLYSDVASGLSSLKGHAVFLYAGGKESKTMEAETREMYALLKRNKKVKLQIIVDPPARHNEAAWQKWFPVYLASILK